MEGEREAGEGREDGGGGGGEKEEEEEEAAPPQAETTLGKPDTRPGGV